MARVEFINHYATATDRMPVPRTVFELKHLLDLPGAAGFKALADGNNNPQLGAAYLLLNSAALIAVHNVRVVDLSSEKADRFYRGLLGNRAEKGWTAAGTEVNAALTKKTAKSGVTSSEARFAAGLYAMVA